MPVTGVGVESEEESPVGVGQGTRVSEQTLHQSLLRVGPHLHAHAAPDFHEIHCHIGHACLQVQKYKNPPDPQNPDTPTHPAASAFHDGAHAWNLH